MKKKMNNGKSAQIGLRITEDVKSRVESVASLRGMDISDYVRDAIETALEQDARMIGAQHGL